MELLLIWFLTCITPYWFVLGNEYRIRKNPAGWRKYLFYLVFISVLLGLIGLLLYNLFTIFHYVFTSGDIN